MIKKLKEIFEEANKVFIAENRDLLEFRVSERTLCGALMIQLNTAIQNSEFAGYKVDVEYNRSRNKKVKTILRMDLEEQKEIIVKINCDLVVHGRGSQGIYENLIAIEMKKSTGKLKDKMSDKHRLMALTKEFNKDVWQYGENLQTHVCDYQLGIYYEVNFRTKSIILEYYSKGSSIGKIVVPY